MCGIVLAGSNYLSPSDLSIFENMLFCDTLRGSHSTGVFAGYYDITRGVTVNTAKSAVNGPNFVKSQLWKSVRSNPVPSKTTGMPTTRVPRFVVGHNRYATMGAKTAENAHPFTHGNITLVHNGTLEDQSLLPNHKEFEVDSENIAYAINEEGIEETIKKLNGAYTLVWHDSAKETVNILRNNKRPFHLALTTTGDWFGASEEEMLMWLLSRDDKYSSFKTSPEISRHFECEVGHQYVFDVSMGKFNLIDVIEHELPKFAPKRTWPSYNNYNYGTSYTHRSTYKSANDYLSEAGIKERVGSRLNFSAYEFKEYSSLQGRGQITGWLESADEYVEVVGHQVHEDDFHLNSSYYGEITSAYISSGRVLTIIVSKVNKASDEPTTSLPVVEPQTEDDEEDGSKEQMVMTEDGAFYTRAEWDRSHVSTCGQCSAHIPFEQADTAYSYGESYICEDCQGSMQANLDAEGVLYLLGHADLDELEQEEVVQSDAPFHSGFVCRHCGMDCTHEQESQLDKYCNECYQYMHSGQETSTIAAITRETKDGLIFTRKGWDKVCSCGKCGQQIPWEEVSTTQYIGETLVCEGCYNEIGE